MRPYIKSLDGAIRDQYSMDKIHHFSTFTFHCSTLTFTFESLKPNLSPSQVREEESLLLTHHFSFLATD